MKTCSVTFFRCVFPNIRQVQTWPSSQVRRAKREGGGGGGGGGREVFRSRQIFWEFRMFNVPEKKQTGLTGSFPEVTVIVNIFSWVDWSGQYLDIFLPLTVTDAEGGDKGCELFGLEIRSCLVWLDWEYRHSVCKMIDLIKSKAVRIALSVLAHM